MASQKVASSNTVYGANRSHFGILYALRVNDRLTFAGANRPNRAASGGVDSGVGDAPVGSLPAHPAECLTLSIQHARLVNGR
jgi:hypothetical protein